MRRRSYQLDSISAPKYKYSFNDKTYDLNVSSSLDNKLGVQRVKETSLMLPDKVKPNANFTLQKLLGKGKLDNELTKLNSKSIKNDLKLPTLKKREPDNPQLKQSALVTANNYYWGRVAKSLDNKQNGYMVALSRQHFIQTIEALRVGRTLKVSQPARQLKLAKKNPKLKTVYLDLDETLIHCDQQSNNYTVKLDFPVEGGSTISAGIRVRPHCAEFIRDLAAIAEVIIFTASSSSYADVVLDYLDPQKKFFSHRLYRQHCTLQKGFYTKDLRCINRRLQDSVLVDNSAFSYMLQPDNGIPVLPYYHFNKDRELPILLDFLKDILDANDVRQKVRKYFFWNKFIGNDSDPKKIFIDNYGKNEQK